MIRRNISATRFVLRRMFKDAASRDGRSWPGSRLAKHFRSRQ